LTLRSLKHYFGENYVSAEQCSRPKPDPDVFLKAKEMVELEKGPVEQWIAVGDGESDVKAGLAADMTVIYLSERNAEYDQHPRVARVRNVNEMREVFTHQLETIFGTNFNE